MKVIYELGTTKLSKTAIAIGVFDGVHRGHQLLIHKAVAQAKRLKVKSMVITFFPHPAHVLSGKPPLPYLMSLEHRLEIFKAEGVDFVWVVRFNKQFAQIDPRYFIKNILVKKLGVKSIFVGENFRFGKDRSGDIHLFKTLSKDFGYQIYPLKPVQYAHQIISSGRLRALIPEGKLKDAQKLLGRPVAILGQVVPGASRGKVLGYPTANVHYQCDVLPPHGVYAVRVVWNEITFYGMANLGVRPSFKEKNVKPLLEVHIFNFNKNLYGQSIRVEFLKKIRDEGSFSSKEKLIAQIQKDEKTVRAFLHSS